MWKDFIHFHFYINCLYYDDVKLETCHVPAVSDFCIITRMCTDTLSVALFYYIDNMQKYIRIFIWFYIKFYSILLSYKTVISYRVLSVRSWGVTIEILQSMKMKYGLHSNNVFRIRPKTNSCYAVFLPPLIWHH